MTDPEAPGRRFLLGESVLTFSEIGDVLREAYPARKLPKGELPNWLVRALSLLNPTLKQIVPELGKTRAFDNSRARALLGRDLVPAREAILESARTLVDLGEL